MLKERREAAERIAASLRAAEQATEKALLAAAELNSTMLLSRSAANISPLVGQEALDCGAAAYAAVANGMRQLIDTHAKLAQAKDRIGLRRLGGPELGFGDVFECPDIAHHETPEAQPLFKVVA